MHKENLNYHAIQWFDNPHKLINQFRWWYWCNNQIDPLSTISYVYCSQNFHLSVLEFQRYIINKSYWDQTCTSRKAKGQFTPVSQNKLWRLAKKFLTIFELFLEVNNLLSSTRIIIITNKDFITLEIFQMHDKSGFIAFKMIYISSKTHKEKIVKTEGCSVVYYSIFIVRLYYSSTFSNYFIYNLSGDVHIHKYIDFYSY